jgi:hypothetical protein
MAALGQMRVLFRMLLDRRVLRVARVLLELRVQLAPLELKEILALPEIPDQQAQLDQLLRLVLPDLSSLQTLRHLLVIPISSGTTQTSVLDLEQLPRHFDWKL